MKLTVTSEGYLPVVCHQFNHVTVPYSQISFIENRDGGVQTLSSDWKIWVPERDFFIQFITSIQRYAYTRFLMKKQFLYEIEIETL